MFEFLVWAGALVGAYAAGWWTGPMLVAFMEAKREKIDPTPPAGS